MARRFSKKKGLYTPSQIILSLLYLVGGCIRGRTRLENLLYLLQEKKGIDMGLKFYPGHFPYRSNEFEETLNILLGLGLIEERHILIGKSKVAYTHKYLLTEEGETRAKNLVTRILDDQTKIIIKDVVDKWGKGVDTELKLIEYLANLD